MALRRMLQTVSLGLVMAAAAAVPARAQENQQTYANEKRVAVGFEAAAVASRRDNLAFFNFTDYEHNALRVARLRLMAEWRLAASMSFIGEVRTEDGNDLDVPALYLRWRPLQNRSVSVQAGRVPPLIGAFPRRAYGRANVVIGWPLAYQYLVSLRPDALPATVDDVLRMRGRGWQPSYPIGSQTLRPGLSLINASRWDTGIQISAQARRLTIAGAITEGPPAHPSVRDRTPGLGWSGRASFTFPAGVIVGASGGTGNWIDRPVLKQMSLEDSGASQHVVGVDAEAGQGHWLVRAEWFRSTFTVPITAAPLRFGSGVGMIEGRYRFGARWQAGARVERLRFDRVRGATSQLLTPWDADVDRVEAALSYRATASTEIKAGWQHNWRDGGRIRERGFAAIQFLVWY